ncbi:MAG: sodium:proton antiporter, partial [Flavobacteriales bacterium]|nr:sodium:proton antiporter [Flavobacteriales bacterium]
ILLSISVLMIWRDNSLGGANQMALLFSAAVAMLIGWRLNFSFSSMLKGVTGAINTALPAILILLLIGSLAGTWLISGIVPTMIYYGLKILNPTIFLFSACVISAIISLATGSSWSTIATVGVALFGIGSALGITPGLVAGAIISGAYFGDKMSPMSDTTNLAPAVAGSDLFTHIRYMLYTTVPSITITLIIFLIWGFFVGNETTDTHIEGMLNALESSFYISPILFIVPLVVIVMIIMKIDAIPALFVGMLLGGIFAVIFQPDLIIENGKKNTLTLSGENIEDYHITWLDESGNELYKYETAYNLNGGTVILQLTKDSTTINKTITLPYAMENEVDAFDITDEGTRLEDLGLSIALTRSSYAESAYRTTIDAMTAETSINTENATINDLLGTSGMFGMMNTIWLIVCAMAFGGVMEKLGMLNTITEVIVAKAKSTGSLIATTALTCVGFNITASDQYLSIVVPGKMFAKEYEKRGLAPQNLSRTLEDAGTVTSVLVPWNTCGAVQSNVLGIATGEYFFYCIFNIISPLMTITFGFLGIKIAKLTKS